MKIAIVGSFILSIIHSILFFRQKAGISVLLFTLPTILFLIYILWKKEKIKNKKSIILIVPIILLSSTYFIFNNKLFNTINIFAILALLGIMIIWMLSEELKLSLLITKIFNIILGPLEFIGNSFGMINSILKNASGKDENSKIKVIKRIIKAIAISLPILFVVLFLLISADDNFAKIFSGFTEYIVKLFTSVEFIYLILRVLLIFVLFIYFVSFLYNILDKESSFNTIEKIRRPKEIKLDVLTINTLLSILNIIYLIFSITQLVSIFNNNLISIEEYSRSARQGFFQLMIVSLINFVLIIISTINKGEEKNSRKYKKLMNVLMIGFTIVILIVSLQRMKMYENNYGYTMLRLLVYFSLATEALLIIPTIIYIIKGKINLFKIYFAIIVVMYVIINFANLDKMIAKRNIDRYMETGKIDIEYIIDEIGTDGIVEIKRLYLEEKNKEDDELYRKINNYLYNEKNDLQRDKNTWQSFNISKYKARKALKDLDLEYKKYNYNRKSNYWDNNI